MRKRSYTPVPADTDPKVLGLFTRNRSFYKMFFPLLLVISLQQLAALAVNMADNLMLGRYTELALSGATLVNQIQFMLMMVASAIGAGIVPKREDAAHKRIHPAIRQAVVLLAVKKQFDDCPVYLDRLCACLFIDGLQIHDPFIVVINVKKPVVVFQIVVDGLGLFPERFLAFCPADDGGHRVKKV